MPEAFRVIVLFNPSEEGGVYGGCRNVKGHVDSESGELGE